MNRLTPDSDQRPTFPRWTPKERDFWMDTFETYSEAFVGQLGDQQEQGDTVTVHLPDEERCIEAVRLAARVADVAVEEMLYRFWVQENNKGPIVRRKRSTKR